jgi:methylmalonyl-CoA mutase
MSPDYGARLQLQKIAMLDVADIVVVNKADLAGAKTAKTEVERRLRRGGQELISTTASRHGDHGVDELYALIRGMSGSPMKHGRAARATDGKAAR